MGVYSVNRLRAILQRQIQTRVWGMDIDPTARIATSALIDRTWPRGIRIGPHCVIDEEAVVLTHDFTRAIYVATTIGARTVVGARAIILPGLTIGEDCVVMPGALVTKDMPAASMAIGNPAKIEARQNCAVATDSSSAESAGADLAH